MLNLAIEPGLVEPGLVEPGVEPAWRLGRAVKPDGVYLVNTTYKVSL